MSPIMVLELLQAAAALAKALAPLVSEGLAVANSQDAAEIKTALAELQAQNDALYDRVQSKLRTAPI